MSVQGISSINQVAPKTSFKAEAPKAEAQETPKKKKVLPWIVAAGVAAAGVIYGVKTGKINLGKAGKALKPAKAEPLVATLKESVDATKKAGNLPVIENVNNTVSRLIKETSEEGHAARKADLVEAFKEAVEEVAEKSA